MYVEDRELVKLEDKFNKIEIKTLYEVKPLYKEFKLIDIDLLKPSFT